jgi:serine/threonine protein kinase
LKENRYLALKVPVANALNKDLKLLTYLRDHGANHPNVASLQDVFTIQGPTGLHECMVFNFLGSNLKRMTDGKHQLSGRITKFQPGQKDPWFDPVDLRHPFETLVSNIRPELTAKEITNLLDLLRGALEYEPSRRLSARQVAKHPWFTS